MPYSVPSPKPSPAPAQQTAVNADMESQKARAKALRDPLHPNNPGRPYGSTIHGGVRG
jgi:hypothetical protein